MKLNTLNEVFAYRISESFEDDKKLRFLRHNDYTPFVGTEVIIMGPNHEPVVAKCIDESEYLFEDIETGLQFAVSHKDAKNFNDDEDDVAEFKSLYCDPDIEFC